jgi:hypothetical protein
LCLALLVTPTARGQTQLGKYVFGSGATAAASSTVVLAGTIGQPLIGRATNSGLEGWFGFWFNPGTPVGGGVEEHISGVTGESATLIVAPNPVTDAAEITASIPTGGLVSLKIFDALGREVRTLIDDRREAGTITLRVGVETLASGNYTVLLTSSGSRRSTTMRVIK